MKKTIEVDKFLARIHNTPFLSRKGIEAIVSNMPDAYVDERLEILEAYNYCQAMYSEHLSKLEELKATSAPQNVIASVQEIATGWRERADGIRDVMIILKIQ